MIIIAALAITPHSDAQTRDPICGDANGDGRVNIMDFWYIYAYVWLGGPPPSPMEVGDLDGDGGVNIRDIVYFWRSAYQGEYPLFDCPIKGREGNAFGDTPGHLEPSRKLTSRERDDSRHGDFVDIDLALKGQTGPADTIYVGADYEIRIWLENSEELYGISMGYFVWAGDGVVWSWVDQPDGRYGLECLTIEADSRADSGEVFNFFILPRVWPNPNPGTEIGIPLASTHIQSLPAGPLEHMISLHFRVNDLQDFGMHMICIDSISFGNYDDDLVYSYDDGSGVYPQPLWPSGGRCWPVALPSCADANSDGSINVADAVFLINFVFKGGPAPSPYCAGDANGDGDVNVADAVYLINYVFKDGPAPVDDCCQ